MQIKNFTDGNIPFLLNYVPFTLASNKQICRTVDDMIEYDRTTVIPDFNYKLGTNDTFSFSFSVKNVTDNAALTIKSNYKENVFLQTENISLNPGETKTITVTSNSEYLNTVTTIENIFSTLSFTVNNIRNGKLITKTI